jgi:hypothetical protein
VQAAVDSGRDAPAFFFVMRMQMDRAGCPLLHRTVRRAGLGLLFAVATTAAAAAEFRGFVSDGPAGLLVFRACRGTVLAGQTFKVSDKSPATALTAGASAVRQVMEDPSRPLYVEFIGESDGKTVTVRRFQRAVGHILACAGMPKDVVPGTTFHASGADTPWRFVATTAGAQLELGPGRTVRFPPAAFVPAESGRKQVLDAWSSRDGGTIRVEVTEEVCLDEQTETASGARVALRYASTSVEGCAVRF